MPRPNTRHLVLEAIRGSKFELTVPELVTLTSLSELTVRKHLAGLLAEKSIQSDDWKNAGKKGRPSKVYWLR